MNKQEDYIRDIAEMRSLMERSSKFLSLSGLAGILAGFYALAGVAIAYTVFDFPQILMANNSLSNNNSALTPLRSVFLLAILVLFLAIGTAVFLSYRKAGKRQETFWNPTAKRLLINMSVPLATGGLLILILIAKGLVLLVAPFTLVFYGLSLYNAGKFTYGEIKSLGLIDIALGLFSALFPGYELICWALGFGVAHIVYGMYMHYRYER